ncbi:hypothetical protein VTI28DRAFT_4788 [Corynascus sepedonium]
MSVEIDPLDLGFRRPFNVEIAQTLKIKNPNSSPVAFKVKTTAPKQYCVRPNSGRIEPGREVEVSILLQAMKQEPTEKCRDKFLVQSLIITPDKEFTNVQHIWDGVEKAAIHEKKIRVSWLPPLSERAEQPVATPVRKAAENGFDATPDTAPPAYSSPQDDTTILEDTTAVSYNDRNEPESAQATQATAYAAAPATNVAATVKSAAAETYEELKEQLAKAEATIASLRNEVASGLRQRKTTSTNKGEETQERQAQQQQQQPTRATEGVPVKIVAVLCLVSFLLAYFLF